MQYYSTNHTSDKVSFKEALLRSEATDQGLYMPEKLPVLPKAFINNISWMSLKEIAYVINNTFFGDDIPAPVLKQIGDETADYIMPLYEIEHDIFVMELFHGPTKTVKDFGARMLIGLLRELLKDSPNIINVLVPTTGHTGNAVAHCLRSSDGVNVFVLYPKGRARQHVDSLSNLGDHIHTIEVNGSIDDCIALKTKAFNDPELNENMLLTSANSMNIGSLLPSSIPFFHAYAQLRAKKEKCGPVYVSVPSGNCGNLLSGYIAKNMGLPIERLICASNINGGFDHYLRTGINDRKARSVNTYSYGIDISFSANVPRFEEICHHDRSRLNKDITSEVCTDAEVAESIIDVYSRTGYLLDPHAAVAYVALKRQLPKGASGIVMATSHPSLSVDALQQIDDGSLKLPFRLAARNYCACPEIKIQPAYGALKKYLKYYSDSNMAQPKFA